MNRDNKVFRMIFCALMVAVATVLSVIKIYRLPFGGSVTAFSMLPILIVGYAFGPGWGLATGLVHGIIQLVFGAVNQAFASQSVGAVIGIMCLDYLVAFTVLGLSGVFRKAFKTIPGGMAVGSAFAMLLRFLSSFLSGTIFFGQWAEWYFTQEEFPQRLGSTVLEKFSGTGLAMIYSAIYNAMYMIPEIVGTVVVILIITNIKPIKEFLKPAEKECNRL